jgi:flagellar basal body-associated protein FliL
MPIRLSCRSCKHKFKVKDSLAGRRTECPECGKRLDVPDPDEEDIDEDEEDRPRKKGKKKGGSSKGLLIGLIGGGVVLIAGVVVLVILLTRGSRGSGGSRNDGKPLEVELPAKRGVKIDLVVNEGQKVSIHIKCEVTDPKTALDSHISVFTETMKKKVRLAQGSGTDMKLEFTPTGFGTVPLVINNFGPGSAKCKVTHNCSGPIVHPVSKDTIP